MNIWFPKQTIPEDRNWDSGIQQEQDHCIRPATLVFLGDLVLSMLTTCWNGIWLQVSPSETSSSGRKCCDFQGPQANWCPIPASFSDFRLITVPLVFYSPYQHWVNHDIARDSLLGWASLPLLTWPDAALMIGTHSGYLTKSSLAFILAWSCLFSQIHVQAREALPAPPRLKLSSMAFLGRLSRRFGWGISYI